MKQTLILCTLLLALVSMGKAQTYSLKQAQEYALQNSFAAQQARANVAIAQSKVKETIGIGLPQIDGEVKYQNFPNIPTTLIPAAAFDPSAPTDQFVAVKFGQPQNLAAGITASQLLFNGSYIVGLQASRAYVEFADNQKVKTDVDIKNDVAQAYHTIIAARENVATLELSLTALKKVTLETKALYENGLAEEQAAQQLQVNLTNLENSLEFAKQQLESAYNLLKFQMGVPQNVEIGISDNLESLTSGDSEMLLNSLGDVNENINYKLALNNLALQNLSLKNTKASVLPTLAAFISQQAQGFSNEKVRFDYFKSNQKYFPTTLIGVNLSIPIFSGGQRYQKIRQGMLEVDKARVMEQQAKEGLLLAQQNARNEYKFQAKNFRNQKDNLKLAADIKEKTLIKFQEGLASSFDVAQAENQYLTAQGSYIKATVDFLNAKVNLQKALNQL